MTTEQTRRERRKTRESAAIQMPIGARVVHVSHQQGRGNTYLSFWAEVDEEARLEWRTFWVYGTGHSIAPGMRYVGTAEDGMFVWHLYETEVS